MDTIFYKDNAKEQLKGKWGLAIKVFFLLTLLSFIESSSNILNTFDLFKLDEYTSNLIKFPNYLFGGVLQLGVCKFALNLVTDSDKASYNDAFSGFNIYFKALILYIIKLVCIIIGTFLLVVPGIILGTMFSQAFYILCEDNSKGVIECLKESSKMMKGYKFDYFVLAISFIGWYLVSILTLGLANFILNPYIEVSYANYYLELKRRTLIN